MEELFFQNQYNEEKTKGDAAWHNNLSSKVQACPCIRGSRACFHFWLARRKEVRKWSKTLIQKISLGIQGYEYGPSVNKLVVELENPVSTVETADVKVQTLSQDRKLPMPISQMKMEIRQIKRVNTSP